MERHLFRSTRLGGRAARRGGVLHFEVLERRAVPAGLSFASAGLATDVAITPPGTTSSTQHGGIPVNGTAASVDNDLQPSGALAYSYATVSNSPSADRTATHLDVVTQGGLTTKTLYSISQKAGLTTSGAYGDVSVMVVPTTTAEKVGDPVTVSIGFQFRVLAYAAQNASASASYDVHYTYNGIKTNVAAVAGVAVLGGTADQKSGSFAARIGDTFTLSFTNLVLANSVAPFGRFNNIGYKTDDALDLSVHASSAPDAKPVLAPLASPRVNAPSTVTLQASATDPDPGQSLVYSLDPGAPAGARIDPKTGAFTWAVPAAEPSGLYPVTVRVTDNGSPPRSDAKTFTIGVNLPPAHVPNVGPFQAAENAAVSGGGVIQAVVVTRPGNVLLARTSGGPSGLILQAVRGDGTFGGQTDLDTTYYNHIAAADFNGDGIPDVVASTSSSNVPIRVFFGNSDGTLQSPFIYSNTFVSAIVTGDFNGDGKPDIATIDGVLSDTVSIYLNQGNGLFRPAVTTTLGFAPQSLAVGDFNHDGKDDLATLVHTSLGGPVRVLFSQGDGTVRVGDPLVSPPDDITLAAGDFDGDGRTDLAVISDDNGLPTGGLTGTIQVMYGNGDGSFGAPVTVASGFNYGSSIAAGDLNRDGKDDIVAGSIQNVTVVLGQARGQAPPRTDYVVDGSPVRSVAIGDVNGDGYPDVVTANETTTTTVLLNRGDGTFPSATRVPATLSATDDLSGPMAVGDFLRDGKTEVAVFADNPSTITPGPNRINLFQVQPDGTARTVGGTDLAVNVTSFSAADLNGDGLPDLLVVPPNGVPAVIYNDGGGVFGPTLLLTHLTPAHQAYAVDLNGDGKPDIVTANGNGQAPGINISLNNGATFADGQNIAISGTVGAVITGVTGPDGKLRPLDLNGDGKPDLVAVTPSFGGPGAFTVLLGRGDGTFQPLPKVVGDIPFLALAGDFDGDGKPDLAFIGGSGVSVYLNQGGGVFGAPITTTQVTTQPENLVAADFNGDGKLDLLEQDANGLAVMLGNGDGTFRAQTYLATGSQRAGLIADLNGDGKPDYVAVANSGKDLSILYNKFTPSRTASDFDGDGKADLAVYGKDPATGRYRFRILTSSTGFSATQAVVFNNQGLGFGNASSIPVAADYFGDGKSAYAIWSPDGHGFMILQAISSANPAKSLSIDFGLTTDVPVVTDVDGDGKADFGVFGRDPNLGYRYDFLLSSRNFDVKQPLIFNNYGFGYGAAGASPVVADFDGSGHAGFGVYIPSGGGGTFTYTNVTIPKGTTGPIVNPPASVFFQRTYGFATDVPMAVDYDGDGKADLALYGLDPRTGRYRYDILTSSTNFNQDVYFDDAGRGYGYSASIPVMADYEGDGHADFAVFQPDGTGGASYIFQDVGVGHGVVYDFATATDLPLTAPLYLVARKVRGY